MRSRRCSRMAAKPRPTAATIGPRSSAASRNSIGRGRRSSGRLIDGRYHGLGIGCYIEGGASGPRESARLVLETDGTVSVYTGSSAVGQGLETVLTQIAAAALGMPMAAHPRRVPRLHQRREGRIWRVQLAQHRHGRLSGREHGKTARTIRERRPWRFGCSPDEIEIIDGREVLGPQGKSVTLGELATGLSAEGTFESNKRTYSYGAHAAHVAVDPRTGHVALVDYVAVEDVGRIINPHTLHGQTWAPSCRAWAACFSSTSSTAMTGSC